jgi:hypothetical protein
VTIKPGNDSFSIGPACPVKDGADMSRRVINRQFKPGRKPTPADWGSKMTICIAAICAEGEAIVSASDTMLSTSTYSADMMAIKGGRIRNKWFALYSGNDISPCEPILRKAKSLFESRDETLEQITASFKESYRLQLQEKIEDEVLSRYKMDLDSFKEHGFKHLGRDVFNGLCQQIDRKYLDCEFLVFGFDRTNQARIFTVTDPGIVTDYSTPGFWAIGSGANSALSTLFFHGFGIFTKLPAAVYHVCEAKFMAESAAGVGKNVKEQIESRLSDEWKD